MKLAIDYSSLIQQAAPKLSSNTTLAELVNLAMDVVVPVAGMIMLLYLLYSGYQYMTSYGDPKAMAASKQNITYAIIGFVVIAFAYIAGQIAGTSLEIDELKRIFGG